MGLITPSFEQPQVLVKRTARPACRDQQQAEASRYGLGPNLPENTSTLYILLAGDWVYGDPRHYAACFLRDRNSAQTSEVLITKIVTHPASLIVAVIRCLSKFVKHFSTSSLFRFT